LILLRRDALSTDLSEAIRTLMAARQIGGDVPATRATLRVRRSNGPGTARKDLPWAARVMADLQKAERKAIKGVGKGRFVVVHLPKQTR
jgi:hypothetical protein